MIEFSADAENLEVPREVQVWFFVDENIALEKVK
jgi:hypothetical protein